MEIRDRIVELRRLPARDLIPNPRNRRQQGSRANATVTLTALGLELKLEE